MYDIPGKLQHLSSMTHFKLMQFKVIHVSDRKQKNTKTQKNPNQTKNNNSNNNKTTPGCKMRIACEVISSRTELKTDYIQNEIETKSDPKLCVFCFCFCFLKNWETYTAHGSGYN